MGQIIKDIQRNNREIIRIEVSEFKGNELINLRIWYQAIDGNGDVIYKPTQKGVAINISHYAELKDGIDKIEQYIKDKESGYVQPDLGGDEAAEAAEAADKEEEEEEEK